jgi:TamB, inner membrane protein subunit of TAM complex
MSKRRKRIRIAQYIFVGLVTLMFSGYFALQLPAVQTWLAHRLSDYLAKEWNTRVSIGRVSIDIWAKLSATDLYIEDQSGDSLIYVALLEADNYSYDDASGKLVVNSLHLQRPYFNLMRHRQDSLLNYHFLVDYFDSGDTSQTQSFVALNHVHLQHGRFNYINENSDRDTTFGIDWNYLRLREIELEVNDFRMEGDSIHGFVTHLAMNESSGFELNEFSQELSMAGGDITMKDTRLLTGDSDIQGDLRFAFKSVDDFDSFETTVPMNHEFRNARLNLNDLSYFAPELRGMNQPVIITGQVTGTVAALKGRKLKLQFNDNSRFKGNFEMEGLPDIDQTFISLDIDELTTNKQELEQIPLPPFDGSTFVQLPNNIGYLGQMTYRGDFTGFLSDFVTYGTITTAIGNVRADISIKEDRRINDYAYSGSVNLEHFDFGTFYQTDAIGAVSCEIALQGTGLELKKVNATFDGNIQELNANGYTFHNILASGNFKHRAFSGNVDINDPNLIMTFDGTIDFAQQEPLLDFEAHIQHANPAALNALEQYEYSSLSGDIKMRSEGLQFEKFVGDLRIEDLSYCARDKDYALNYLYVNSVRKGTPTITLQSDIAFAELKGEYTLSQIAPSLAEIVAAIFPSFKPPIREHKTQNFTLAAQIYDVSAITEVFVPELKIAPGTRVTLEINEPDSFFQTTISSPHFSYRENQIEALTFDIRHPDESFYVTASCDALHANDIYFRDIALDGRTHKDTLYTSLSWDNGNRQFEGDINGKLAIRDFNSFDFIFDNSSFTLERERWFLEPGAKIGIDSARVHLQQLNIINGLQRVELAGTLHNERNSELRIGINSFDLKNLGIFLGDDYRIQGILDAKATLRDPYNESIFSSSVSIANFILNEHTIGDLNALSTWDTRKDELRIDGKLEREAKGALGLNRYTPLSFAGYYRPKNEKSPLDLTATIHDLDLDFINAFMEPEVLDMQGYASGTMSITGTPDAPQMRANALLKDASIYVYYLNTKYYVEDHIGVYPDMFTFDHIPIRDEKGKSGFLTGQMLHNNFSDWNFDILIDMEEPMLAMNTNEDQNSLYYGQAFATGNISIYGYDSNLEFDIALRSEKGTTIALPMGTSDEQEFENFIRFVAPGDSAEKTEDLNLSGIKLNLQLEITPEADFKIIFDESVGDIIYGAGRGNLQMVINNLATFNMYGGIELTRGKYDFTLKNLINKTFELKPGGTISWFGDPFGGEIDLRAVYPIQASLYDLIQDPAYQNGQRVPVELGMNMSGKIFSPGIDFSIDLPTVDQITKSRVNAVISTDQERNRQAFALLAMRRFISPPNVTADHSSTSAIAANGTEFLSSQISSWLSQISDDFNLGFNYNPGDDISNEQIALALGTQLFNERLSLSSNFGVSRNNGTSTANQNATNIIGDIRIEYKITPEGKIRLVMYNQSNDFRANTVQQSPYTQGVGVIYREDFDTFNEFLDGFKKLLKGKDKSSSAMQ